MNDFQRYLDDALDRLDVKDTAQMTAGNEDRTDYSIEKDISELLLALRKDMGISQKELSEITGIPQSNISKIENGHYLPSLSILKRVADALGKRLTVDFIDVSSSVEDYHG